MRSFLPIKGPGGRALTNKEKIALLVLGLTLVLCVLTLLAGERAYTDSPAQNPVFAFVSWLGRALGGGIVALYGLVMLWSGLLYFKGERAVDMDPLAGRLLAGLALAIGISGVLGIAQFGTAGSLGAAVGSALHNTFGAALGLPLLLGMMGLGAHLASQGAWSAMRTHAVAASPSTSLPPPPPPPFGVPDAPPGRLSNEPPMPDDGDPTPDERSLAVTQAMEEIERRQGVTIVDMEPEAEERPPSIGEEVDEAPLPPPETEEAEVQRGLDFVARALTPPPPTIEEDVVDGEIAEEEDEEEPEPEEEETFTGAAHGFVPVPAAEADDEEAEYEDEYEESEDEVEEEEPEPEEEDESGDPYAQGGLLRRLGDAPKKDGADNQPDLPFTNFDWRGRPKE